MEQDETLGLTTSRISLFENTVYHYLMLFWGPLV